MNDLEEETTLHPGRRRQLLGDKAGALILGGVMAVVVGSVLLALLTFVLGMAQTQTLWDSFTAGGTFGLMCALVSAVAIGLSMCLVIPLYVWYDQMLSVRAATILGIFAGVFLVVALLLVLEERSSLSSYYGILGFYGAVAAFYGGLTGYFASSLEHNNLKQQYGMTKCLLRQVPHKKFSL